MSSAFYLILLFTFCAFYCNGKQLEKVKELEMEEIALAVSKEDDQDSKLTDYSDEGDYDMIENSKQNPFTEESTGLSDEIEEEKESTENDRDAEEKEGAETVLETTFPTITKELPQTLVTADEEEKQKIASSSQIEEAQAYFDQQWERNSQKLDHNSLTTWENIKEFLSQYGFGTLNVFRVAADIAHIVAILILLLKLLRIKSCDDISWKTQFLYLLVFVTRYLDLFDNFVSLYNSAFKIFFLGSSSTTLLLTLIKSKASDTNGKYDTFHIGLLIVPVALLAVTMNYNFTVMEVLWTFSIHLESVAIVPQLFLLVKKGEVEKVTLLYLSILASYRALYICNWAYRYYAEDYLDHISVLAGVTQTLIYAGFFIYMFFIRRYCFKTSKKNVVCSKNDHEKIPIIAYV